MTTKCAAQPALQAGTFFKQLQRDAAVAADAASKEMNHKLVDSLREQYKLDVFSIEDQIRVWTIPECW